MRVDLLVVQFLERGLPTRRILGAITTGTRLKSPGFIPKGRGRMGRGASSPRRPRPWSDRRSVSGSDSRERYLKGCRMKPGFKIILAAVLAPVFAHTARADVKPHALISTAWSSSRKAR